jgi:hypothetical protein
MRPTKFTFDKWHWATFAKLAALAVLLTGSFPAGSMAATDHYQIISFWFPSIRSFLLTRFPVYRE